MLNVFVLIGLARGVVAWQTTAPALHSRTRCSSANMLDAQRDVDAQRSMLLMRRRRGAEAALARHIAEAPLATSMDAVLKEPSTGPGGFSTTTTRLTEDAFVVDLRMASSQRLIGRANFVVDPPDERGESLLRRLAARKLGSRLAVLKNMDIIAGARGRGGGKALLATVAEVLAHEEPGISHVFLQHVDRGSGKLISWYEGLSFRDAASVLPEASSDELAVGRFMVTELASLRAAVRGDTRTEEAWTAGRNGTYREGTASTPAPSASPSDCGFPDLRAFLSLTQCTVDV
jgi:hypothetical protein